jgi:hypothetical protein
MRRPPGQTSRRAIPQRLHGDTVLLQHIRNNNQPITGTSVREPWNIASRTRLPTERRKDPFVLFMLKRDRFTISWRIRAKQLSSVQQGEGPTRSHLTVVGAALCSHRRMAACCVGHPETCWPKLAPPDACLAPGQSGWGGSRGHMGWKLTPTQKIALWDVAGMVECWALGARASPRHQGRAADRPPCRAELDTVRCSAGNAVGCAGLHLERGEDCRARVFRRHLPPGHDLAFSARQRISSWVASLS